MPDVVRYGIAELFGRQIDRISKIERDKLLQYSIREPSTGYPRCPFRLPDKQGRTDCVKKGGVCSIRKYRNQDGAAERLQGSEGTLTVVCPHRLYEALEVFKWAGEHILGVQKPSDLLLVKEAYFLQNPAQDSGRNKRKEKESAKEDVGRIDLILVDRKSLLDEFLRWCAVEIQAVYFSGEKMKSEFSSILNHAGELFPFPGANRRPDYRSSAPKRLMPQLQIKIPALRRWGKKMAVVVDNHFFDWITPMKQANDVSNADIVWLVAGFNEEGDTASLCRHRVVETTLEHAVEGLTGGEPVALSAFEARIKEKAVREGYPGA